jgi:hypothetical protein
MLRHNYFYLGMAVALIGIWILLADNKKHDRPSIIGRWVSESVEERPGQGDSKLYLRRDFTTTSDRSTAIIQLYSDPEGKIPSLKIELAGSYEILNKSADVASAYEANFHFDSAKLTPQNDFFVALFNKTEKGTCGTEPWSLNTEQNVTETGCSPIGVDIKTKNTEYDLVKVEDNKLYYGARPTDGSGLETPEKRPKALQTPLVRSE